MTDIIVEGGRSLIGSELTEAPVHIADGIIADIGHSRRAANAIDATGMLVLPGIVDIHGDAFERQIMPRPGVDFPIDVALMDSDRQLIVNGITTAFHGVTWSWEPGLRGAENAHALIEAIGALQPSLLADTRIHLRHETFNLAAEPVIKDWIATRRIDLLAFNDHMSMTALDKAKPEKRARMAERTGLSPTEFDELVERTASRGHEVPASIARLAGASHTSGIPTLSHDDQTPDQRRALRTLGIRIAEFPVNEETAREAVSAEEFTVLGAPNVVRGGSHTGWVSATDMIRKGLCRILASDYYYPAMLLAAFRLVHDGVLPLPQAWNLISHAPAVATGLTDRGRLSIGNRADLILVDATQTLRPRVVAVIVGGRLVHLTEAHRLSSSPMISRRMAAV